MSGRLVEFRHVVIDPHPAGTFNDLTLILDVNGDGYSDIVIGGLKGEDNLVWYGWPTWRRHVIGSAPLEAGGAVFALNPDGRPGIVAGEMQSNHLYWWENQPDPRAHWTRRVIEDRISANYHDQASAQHRQHQYNAHASGQAPLHVSSSLRLSYRSSPKKSAA